MIVLGVVLASTAQVLLRMSHEQRTTKEREHLLRAARQVSIVAEQIDRREISRDLALAWIDATRIFIGQWEAQHARIH